MQAQTFGRYEIQWEVGRGGMASVFVALDPATKRQVAIKVLPRSLAADPEFRDRFQREAQVIAALEHPNIVPVYDFGEHDYQPYIVMRFMPGGSLTPRVREQPFSVPGALRILERMAEALEAAHLQGIIHRDFKPDNILFDQNEDAFLSDFGIVRILTSSGAITSGTVAGTPAYMSPEQVHADEDVDGRTDVYSMGVTLFEMLTGAPPFSAPDGTRLMMKHVLEPTPSILQVKADLPEGIEAVIQRAMAKDRTQRYQTPGELVDALAGVGRQTLSRRARRRLTASDVEAIFDAIEEDHQRWDPEE